MSETARAAAGGKTKVRPRIYQLMVRHFGNTNETRQYDGDRSTNGCGRFADLDEGALAALRELGITHLWLTGVLEHASRTAYPGRPADDPAIVKGQAGSPYAIRDYFDVSPDYALDPARRLDEFRALLQRCERAGLRTLLDFVPNHVARSYASDVRPDHCFGRDDDRSVFFARDNNFFYLGPDDPGGGPPLTLPVDFGARRVVFEPERSFGRVTGNNVRNWAPAIRDWFETVKLNYGHDFTRGRDTSHLPGPDAGPEEVPDTWRRMDAVLAYWQDFRVGGFRADMAHLVPVEFWRWAIGRARARHPESYFLAEAYDRDPAKLTERNVEEALLEAGFDAVYDSEAYRLVRGLYEGPKWANDFDWLAREPSRFAHGVRYAENHDEVRLSNPRRWGGHGMAVGKPVAAVLFGQTSGPLLVYNGQEVGEPAVGASGFSGDDGRTTIFDYWSLPELAKWVNGHRYDSGRLSPEQRELRAWYGKLLKLCGEPAIANGEFVPLNPANLDNPPYGREPGEEAGGHWLYSFARLARDRAQRFLVVVNLHPREAFRDVTLRIPQGACESLFGANQALRLVDRLATDWSAVVDTGHVRRDGLPLPELAPCSALYLEVVPSS